MAVPIRWTATRSDHLNAPAIVSTYREFAPEPFGSPAILCTWEGNPGWTRPLRLLPDGCVDLVCSASQVQVVRPRSTATWHHLDSHTCRVGVRLRPGWAAAFLGVPIGALPDIADLDDIWTPGQRWPRIEVAPSETRPQANWRRMLTALVDRRLVAADQPDGSVLAAVELFKHGNLSVAAVADHVGFSARQLRRRFDDQIGLTPKAFQMVARFQRFRAHTTGPATRRSLADVAALCGYSDHAHLAHDCRTLASATPTQLTG